MSRDEERAWEVFMQGLDVTSGELVNGARKECGNPLTMVRLLELHSHRTHNVVHISCM